MLVSIAVRIAVEHQLPKAVTHQYAVVQTRRGTFEAKRRRNGGESGVDEVHDSDALRKGSVFVCESIASRGHHGAVQHI